MSFSCSLNCPFFVKSIKRSGINIRRSMLDVRCPTFKAFSLPLEDSLFGPGGISYEVSSESSKVQGLEV